MVSPRINVGKGRRLRIHGHRKLHGEKAFLYLLPLAIRSGTATFSSPVWASAHSPCLSRPPERMWTNATARGRHQGGTQPMTSHETASTTTPGAPPRDGTAAAHVRPPGADPGRSQRRLPPGLSGAAVPVTEHRPRPGRPSHRVLRPRRAGRRAHHAPDPPVPTRPARRRGGHRHHQPALVHNSRSRSIIALHPEIRGPA